jgi:arylsulfatase A-like enzyme
MPERPNILVVVFDTARADAFEPYGAAAGSSPAFADLAAKGFAHDAAYSNACWTVPSHAALFTGLLPADTGLIRAPGGRPEGCRAVLEAQAERLLPTVLADAGWRTGAVSTNLWITPLSGFSTGFESFHTVDTRRQATMSADSSRRARSRWILEGVRARADDGAAEAREALSAFLDEGSGDERPFFAFVNLVEAHSPYLPPKPFNPLGPLDRARAASEASKHLTMGEIWRACAGGFDVPDEALERMRTLYAAAIRALDAWLADVLGELDSRGVLEETIVIVTADHGENLGEGNLMGHAYSLDQRLIRLPFAAAGPLEAPEGVFSLASVPSLLADAVGLESHPWQRAPGEPTAAVAQFDPPAEAGDPRVEQALDSWGLPHSAAERITTPLRSATDGRWKLLRRGAGELVFDLHADPLEEAALVPAEAGAAPLQALRTALAAAEEAQPAAMSAASAGTAAAAADDISAEERAALEERMRLLGYM